MSLDKISDPRGIRHWPGHMETDYVYTHGVAGERFFREIKEKARIMGTKCKRCGVVYVPARMYCERCFEKLEEWVDVGKRGKVHAYTVAYIDMDGCRLKEPIVYAMIKMDGADGGLVHRLGEVNLKELEINMGVEAVFKLKAQREGSINDIRYFKPTK